ncbi:hypothetical protein [Phocaeicola barnesiae]|uniref:hypothetical protein n=1 Tax=Phocaeicola barnesiae TaxID=376804 RepID=UPI0025A401B1|nr:hypothetical protein [Phocaeicola barnesiae]MDM8255367.1 hypothetical protein [Phocaeicola barnesiae]
MYDKKQHEVKKSHVFSERKNTQRFCLKDTEIVGEKYVPYRKNISTFIIQRQDPIEEAILKDTDYDEIKSNINKAMEKIKKIIKNWANQDSHIKRKLNETVGRDVWVYRGFFHRHDTLMKCLEDWDESWSFIQTCGLLLDLGNNLRHFKIIKGEGSPPPIMNQEMKESRLNGNKINRDSKWAKDLPEGTKLQSGVSATTGNLLNLLKKINKLNIEEIESIIVGVISYWKNGSWIKWITGSFHTATEVWSAYTYYLENVQEQSQKQETTLQAGGDEQ